MFWRILALAVLVIASMPALSFGLGMVSAADDMKMVVGFAELLVLVVGWYFIGRNYFSYFKKIFSEEVAPAQESGNKNIALLSVLILAAMSSTACGRTVIEPGHVGIQVNSYGQNKGVSDYPAVTGVTWYNPFTTSVIQYPVFVQNVSWTKDPGEGHPRNEEISFNTGDQMVVYADISLAYQLEAAKAPEFYVKFRADDIDKWTHGFLRNLTRQKFDEIAGKYKIEQIMGDNAPFLKEVRDTVQKDLDPYGVHLEQLGFNGSPRPPQAVIDSINGKVKATQDAIRVENEVRQTNAQAQKDVAKAEGEAKAAIAKANGEAKANQILTSSLTPQLLQWRQLDINEKTIGKWNGALSTYSGGAMPFIQLPAPK